MRLVFTNHGDLVQVAADGTELDRLPIKALPDARLLLDHEGRALSLTHPTDRYRHGVLGDDLEATGISLLEIAPSLRILRNIQIVEPQVIEGITPIWADLNGDGAREIIVTLSDASRGARLVVYNELGEVVATGPDIGRGFRWRHQIAVAPFGPGGELELVDVLTPHLGGVVEFFRWQAEKLVRVASVSGYSSHALGSRNLDMAAAGDFDGDGRIELLVPSQNRERLGGIRHTSQGGETVWEVPIGGQISTNLSGLRYPDGRMIIGVGRSDEFLRLWPPDT
jgi:hypothetical protein